MTRYIKRRDWMPEWAVELGWTSKGQCLPVDENGSVKAPLQGIQAYPPHSTYRIATHDEHGLPIIERPEGAPEWARSQWRSGEGYCWNYDTALPGKPKTLVEWQRLEDLNPDNGARYQCDDSSAESSATSGAPTAATSTTKTTASDAEPSKTTSPTPKATVQRYSPESEDGTVCGVWMEEDDNGDWVRYSDYERMEREARRYARHVRQAIAMLERADAEIETLRAQLADMAHAERKLSDAYLRLRSILRALDTPQAPTAEQVWAHTETKAKELQAQLAEERAARERITNLREAMRKDLHATLKTNVEQVYRIEQLEAVLRPAQVLVREYLCNPGTASEFIACITPERGRSDPENKPDGVWATWQKLYQALAALQPQEDKP